MTEPNPVVVAAMRQLIAARQELFVDDGIVHRPSEMPDTPDLDPDTGLPADPPEDAVVAEGLCTIADPSSALQGHRTVNDESGVPNQRILRTPHSWDLRPGDLFTVRASSFSPGLVGSVFVIAGEEERSFATYRRWVIRGSSWESATTGG